MKIVYILFYNNDMCFAFETREQAEKCLQQIRLRDIDRIYKSGSLRIDSVPYLDLNLLVD